jgi:predicted Zn-dependent peptidase
LRLQYLKPLAILLLCTFTLSAKSGGVSAQESTKQSFGAEKIATFGPEELKWKVPEVGKEVKREVLKNGMILYLMENHELPLFEMQAIIRTGSIFEPLEQTGLASLTGTVMRTGGTESMSPEEVNRRLEYIGASLETWIGSESGGASLFSLSKYTDEALDIFAEVLMHPSFNEEKLGLEKEKRKEAIRRRNDRPGAILDREFDRLLYADHPYGRVQEWETIRDLSSEELKTFHQRYYKPNNIILGIAGDFKTEQIKKKIRKVFGGWKREEVSFPSRAEVTKAYRPGVYLIEKEITQSNVRMGHLAVKLGNPDEYAIRVMNFILGGGSFTSRMTSKVRSDEGLAYSVGSSFDTESKDYGTFSASCQTKVGSTHRALELMLEEIKKIREGLVTEEELQTAKEAYINRYVFNFTDPMSILSQLMYMEYNDRPKNYLQTYLENVRKVTREEVLRVAKEYLEPEGLTLLVVGDLPKFDKPLDDLGKVTKIPLEEPKVD